jgi:NAD(P)-dependent dehydrogenase (short-subunit alcohol dehydrogenase family)
MEISGRVALVTGGARRVGRVLALGLAREGADIIVHYHRSRDEADETVAEIEALGRRALALSADLAQADDVTRMATDVRRELGRLDILVNSASLFERAAFDDITPADFDRVIGTNLRGPFFLSQAAAPMLREANGVIINIGDLSALQPWPSYAHHAVSKAGLVHLTRVLARALAPAIRVNAIVPGTVLPPDDWDGSDGVHGQDRRVLDRAGQPEDVLDALLYLVRADFVTGQTLIVDGGRTVL